MPHSLRIQGLNTAPIHTAGRYVLYWMIANRRPSYNFALDRAITLAGELGRPLVILEALRVAYPWASDRLHHFVLAGMADHRHIFASTPITYYPYVEPSPGEGSGLVEQLSEHACVVVTDDYPCFFLPRMVAAAASRLKVRMEAIDSNGLLPVRATDRVFHRAVDFRRYVQHTLPGHLADPPQADPLSSLSLPHLEQLPDHILSRWPMASDEVLTGSPAQLAQLPLDHSVGVVPTLPGGHFAAQRQLTLFLDQKLASYGDRSDPSRDVASGLSPWLHFGHISAHQIFFDVMSREGWNPSRILPKVTGSREGWWGVGPAAEAFLDELIVWREVGFNFSTLRPDYDLYTSLPTWIQETLEQHTPDPRPVTYTLEQLEMSSTHDEIWNAAQNQLRIEGRIHNYLRMLWGKKILEWSPTPRQALEVMIHLNNKYALDGRDPNSYCGIFWILGRYDRPWAPIRPIFGSIRYMSSDNTRRKFQLGPYLSRWGRQVSLPLKSTRASS